MIADGYPRIWAALAKQQQLAEVHRCWNHKIVNVQDAILTKHRTSVALLSKAVRYVDAQRACERLHHQLYGRTTRWLRKPLSG